LKHSCCLTAGLPDALVAAGGASVALCALGASFCCALAFPHGPASLIWFHLPISAVTGCGAGAATALACSLRAFWATPHQQAAVLIFLGQALAFLGCVRHF
jgi:hypothetical protein